MYSYAVDDRLSKKSSGIQVNILHIRALVKANTVILFDTLGSTNSKLHSVFLYHLEVDAHPLIADTDSSRPTSIISGPKEAGFHMNFGKPSEIIVRPHFVLILSPLEP